MQNFDVIVIGAGNAGLSSALTCALEGKSVLVLERHNIPGGCGTSFRRGKFEFEVALHQLSQMGTEERQGPLRKLFHEYGIMDKLEFVQIDSLFKVNLPSGEGIAIPANRKQAEEVLIERFPREKANILKYFQTVYDFSIETDKFLESSAKSAGKEASSFKKMMVKAMFGKMYPTLAKYGLKSTDEVMDEFFADPEIKLCLSVYWTFMGMSPARFPFSILARCTYLYIEDSPFYLKGGSQMISQALAERIKELGGKIKYNCGAKKINVENNKVSTVVCEDGTEYSCGQIISNISPQTTYANLVGKENTPAECIDYFKSYTPGISALTCFIGLDCPPETVGFTDSFNLTYDSLNASESFDEAYKLMPEKDPIICTCYTIDDPTVSPEGTSVITAGTLKYGEVWENLSPEDYYATKYEAASMLIDRLEKRYPGLRSHIEELEIATPLTHMRYLNHPGGSIYGFEQDIKSSVYFFPQETFIEGLNFASGWTNICGFGPNYLYGNKVGKAVSKEV